MNNSEKLRFTMVPNLSKNVADNLVKLSHKIFSIKKFSFEISFFI